MENSPDVNLPTNNPTADPQGWISQAESFNQKGADEIADAINERLDMEITLCQRNVEHLTSELAKIAMQVQREEAIRAELAWNERKRDALIAARDRAIAAVKETAQW